MFRSLELCKHHSPMMLWILGKVSEHCGQKNSQAKHQGWYRHRREILIAKHRFPLPATYVRPRRVQCLHLSARRLSMKLKYPHSTFLALWLHLLGEKIAQLAMRSKPVWRSPAAYRTYWNCEMQWTIKLICRQEFFAVRVPLHFPFIFQWAHPRQGLGWAHWNMKGKCNGDVMKTRSCPRMRLNDHYIS